MIALSGRINTPIAEDEVNAVYKSIANWWSAFEAKLPWFTCNTSFLKGNTTGCEWTGNVASFTAGVEIMEVAGS